jgi:hypothetical protein
MISRELNHYLNETLTIDVFKDGIRGEVADYESLMKKKGSTINLYYDDVENVYLNKVGVTKLLEVTISGNLTNIELAYICDCLTLAEKIEFESEQIEDLIFGIADPEINGGFKTEMELKSLLEKVNA